MSSDVDLVLEVDQKQINNFVDYKFGSKLLKNKKKNNFIFHSLNKVKKILKNLKNFLKFKILNGFHKK